jgi:hypothetical protein
VLCKVKDEEKFKARLKELEKILNDDTKNNISIINFKSYGMSITKN